MGFRFQRQNQACAGGTAEPEQGFAKRERWRPRVEDELVQAWRNDDGIDPSLRRQLSAHVDHWRPSEA